MSQLTDTVISLQSVLARIDELQSQHDEVPESIREQQREYDEIQAEMERLQAIIDEAEVERRSATGEAEDQQEKAGKYQEQITSVQTQREYGALLSEIDTSMGKAKASEEKALAAVERHAEAVSTLEELDRRFKEVDESFRTEHDEWEKRKPQVLKEIKTLRAEADGLRSALPPAARTMFQRLYDLNHGQPLARIIRVERANKKAPAIWRCSECNYSIRPQLVVEVRTSEELVLSECCRQKILVVEAEDELLD